MNPRKVLPHCQRVILTAASVALLAIPAWAWNLDAKHINALRLEKSGQISFTLFASGTGGNEFLCGAAGASRAQWFFITPCGSTNAQCIAAVNRMSNTLLEAKMARKAVHVQREGCNVTEVALKP